MLVGDGSENGVWEAEAEAINDLYLKRDMVPSDANFIWRQRNSEKIVFLIAVDAQSFCEWKGIASYWDLSTSDGRDVRSRAGWSYQNPTPIFDPFAGWISLYPRLVDECLLEGEVVLPQPGTFYGGWITSWTIGPFKGDPAHPELI